ALGRCNGGLSASQIGKGHRRRRRRCKGCRFAFKTRAAGIAEKTLGLSLAGLVISLHCQPFTAQVQFLTRIDPVSMVRAALGGGTTVICPDPPGGSKAGPTTHEKKVTANTPRPTGLRSPRGLSVSAGGSAASMLPVLPKAARVNARPPIRRRSPAVFGSRPSS